MAMTYQQAMAVLARRDYEREERRREAWRRAGRRVGSVVTALLVVAVAAVALWAYLPGARAAVDLQDAAVARAWDAFVDKTGATGVQGQVDDHNRRLSDAILVSTGDPEMAEIGVG